MCSALLFPIACFAYCTGHVNNVHVQPRAADLRYRYGEQLKELQYRYRNPQTHRHEGGIVVSDAIAQRNGSLMFREAGSTGPHDFGSAPLSILHGNDRCLVSRMEDNGTLRRVRPRPRIPLHCRQPPRTGTPQPPAPPDFVPDNSTISSYEITSPEDVFGTTYRVGSRSRSTGDSRALFSCDRMRFARFPRVGRLADLVTRRPSCPPWPCRRFRVRRPARGRWPSATGP